MSSLTCSHVLLILPLLPSGDPTLDHVHRLPIEAIAFFLSTDQIVTHSCLKTFRDISWPSNWSPNPITGFTRSFHGLDLLIFPAPFLSTPPAVNNPTLHYSYSFLLEYRISYVLAFIHTVLSFCLKHSAFSSPPNSLSILRNLP